MQRSKDAPMDWTYTNRGNIKPAWATDTSSNNNDPSTPKKRPFERATSLNITPTFGANNNVPFLFNQPPQPSSSAPPWVPPANLSPTKMFPSTPAQPEIADVEMNEVSPPKPEDSPLDGKRAVAAGALRRVFKSRNQRKFTKHHSQPQPLSRRFSRDWEGESDDDEDHDEDDDTFDEGGDSRALRRATSTSNHFTLNMAAPEAPKSDLPYVLLGYLQFFFNLSLILVFLYLLLQFILTVQRDVEKRMADYSMDVVHDIATCALHYQENNCETPFPALKRQCKEWESCMNRDPMTLGRARVVAELIAEVVNGFVEPISWKTLGFTLTSLAFLTTFINTLLSLYRSRHVPQPVAAAPAVPQPLFPVGPYMSPAPTPRWSRTWPGKDEPETPARRRRLEGGNVAKVS